MLFENKRKEETLPDEAFLTKSRGREAFSQEILIRSDGSIEIPWITPRASNLVRALWKEFGDGESICMVGFGDIYCG
jgi:hypothetical protein